MLEFYLYSFTQRQGTIMSIYELKLDPRRIKSIQSQKKLQDKYEVLQENQKKLRLKLSMDRNLFYKLKPRDIKLQTKHNRSFYLSQVKNTINASQNTLDLSEKLFAANELKNRQLTTNQYKTSINNKYLEIKNLEQKKMEYRIRPTPFNSHQ